MQYLEILELKDLCTNPTTPSEILKDLKNKIKVLENNTAQHFLFAKLIVNPNIAFIDWLDILELENNTEFASIALTNPIIDLWLLENPAQWENINKKVAELLLKIPSCSEIIKKLCEIAIENARKAAKLVPEFKKFIVPITRRVFPNLIAFELTNV